MDGRPLIAWMHAPSNVRGIHFARSGDDWDFWSYDRLTELTRQVAWGLVDAGVRANDVVSIIERSGPEFVAAFFGAMLAGATPSPVAPPLLFQRQPVYDEHVRGVLIAARPSIVVTHAELVDRIGQLAAAAGVGRALTIDDLLARGASAGGTPGRPTPDLALLQFTSGSSGPSRGVQVPFDALEANVAAIRSWLQWTEDDPFGSWLPVYHDMGLIGAVVCSVVGRSDLWLLQPEQFVRRPARYLRCFGTRQAKLTVMPNFGLDYIVRRVRDRDLTGCDFGAWRGIVIGAERIDSRTLDAYSALLAPFGFDRRALLPAYGLAEASLAVTGLPIGEAWTGTAVDAASLSPGRSVVSSAPDDPAAHVVVGCGRPLDGVTVAIVGEDGRSLSDRTVGEIVVRGSSLAAGYVEAGGSSASLTRFEQGALRTGDAGFIVDGQLFVLGRLGDSLKVRGQVIFGEDLEVALGALGVPRDRVVALLGMHQGAATVVLVFEKFNSRWQPAEALIRPLATGAEIVLIDAPSGTIARTSSGKPKRGQLWREFVRGVLPGRIVTRSEPST